MFVLFSVLWICSDTRLGVQFQTVATDFPKVFPVNDRTFIGLSGLATDIQTVHQLMTMRANLYKLREERDIPPRAFAAMLSAALYERRFGPWFVEPIVAGLEADNKPFITGMDLIGCPIETDQFVVAGTCTNNLHGMCEALWKPDMVNARNMWL